MGPSNKGMKQTKPGQLRSLRSLSPVFDGLVVREGPDAGVCKTLNETPAHSRRVRIVVTAATVVTSPDGGLGRGNEANVTRAD